MMEALKFVCVAFVATFLLLVAVVLQTLPYALAAAVVVRPQRPNGQPRAGAHQRAEHGGLPRR
jgi:hypothetical protein